MPNFVAKQNKMANTNTLTILLSVLLFMQSQAADAYTDHRHAKVDSAEQVLRQRKDLTDKERMDCYYTIVRGTLGKDTEKHEHYCREMLALTYRMNALNMRENALYQLGLQHYGKEDYEPAERYFLWALAVTDSMHDDKRYAESTIDDNLSQLYGALGNLYNIQDKALLAIEYYQKALPIFEKYDWKESQTILHHNVAELWLTMGNSEKAEHEYLRAIETGTASGDSLMMALPRKGLSKVYLDKEDYNRLSDMLLPAYHYYHAHSDEEHNDYAEILASMAKMHLMKGHEDLAKAKTYVQEALSYDNGELMFETRADVHAAAAMVAMREHNWQQALHHARQSVHENDDEATYSDVSCYELLAQIHMELGDKEKAVLYINKVREMMERFATEHYQSGLSQMEVLYETKQKQEAIEQLTREKQWYFWGGTLLAVLLLLMALIFFLLLRSVRLTRKGALIKAKLDGEVAERSRISKDLHDGLGGMLTLLKLKTEGGAPKAEVLQQIDETATELRHIAHHLMPEQLLKNGLATALQDLAISIPNAKFTHFGDDRRLNQDIEVVLYRCAYELVNNAIKHAKASHIDLQLMQENHQVTLTVSDNGYGMKNEEPAKTEKTGMGLQSIRERISHYRGTMNIIDKEGQGTEINIILPA